MNLNSLPPQKMLLFCFIVIFQFSCSKDSDLLTDYVISDTSVSKGIANLVVDDTYQVSLSGSIVLDVLANDTFENGAAVVITETSTPTNGTVIINNDDETLTYTPTPEIIEQVSDTTNTAASEVVDTFTYTAEVVNEDGTASSEEASVVITAGDNAAKQDAVSLQSYGAVGDGVTDDTAAIQNAFDNETNITSDSGKTYLVSGQIKLDQNLTQTIDFNGSKITRKTPVSYPLWIDKSPYGGTNTSISNLEVDGNRLSGSLVYIESRVQFTNVNIHDAIASGGGAVRGIWIAIKNEAGQEGQWVFDNVDIDNITNSSNTAGEAQAFYVYWPVKVTNGIQIVYKNSTLSNTFGKYGNLIILTSPNNDISFSNNSLWFENLTLYNAQRRAVKNYIGNTTWVNCDFYSADNDNPQYLSGIESAPIFDTGAASSALGSQNNLICGCNFYGGYTQPLNGTARPFQITATAGKASVEIRHSTFNGDSPNNPYDIGYAGMAIWSMAGSQNLIGDVKICDCDFTLGSTATRGNLLHEIGGFTLAGNPIQIDSNNSYAIGQTAALAGLSTSKYEIVDFSNDCDACPSIDD